MKKFCIGFAFALSLGLISSQSSYATGNDNPTGVTGQYNGSITTAGSYDPYTGNATRTITDLSVTGAVGAYPLKWTRTLNTRSLTGPTQMGRGGWTHSYQWHIYLRQHDNPPHWNEETKDYYEGPDAVVSFPDGRQVWFEGEPGYDYAGAPEQDASALLKYVGGGNYDLYLTDGGRVQFELGRYLDGTVTRTGLLAQRIVDPYGVVTTLHRDSAGRLWRVQEQGGRFLEITYTNRLITRVQTFASEGNLVETVSYVYGYLGTYLTQVNYDDFTDAFYTYQGSNHTGTYAALIRTCDDVRYAGPMGKIEYVYMPTGVGIDFGQIRGEKYPGSSALVSQVSYPAYACCAGNDPAGFVRTETRADDATRTFQYGIGGGELTDYSDFKNQWSSTRKVIEPGNPFLRRINTDARTNPTTIEKTFHGKTNRFYHPDGSYQAFVYDYSVNGYPYYVLIHGDELGRNTFYTRDANHRVSKIWYGFNNNDHYAYPTEEFTYNPLGQVLTHKLTSGGTEVFEYDNGLNDRGLKTKHTDPLGNVTEYGYYQNGVNADRLWYVEDPHGNRTWYEYNLRGQITKVMHQDGNYTQSRYNDDGTLAWTADENQPGAVNDPNQRTRYIYDEYKRVVSVTNPMNETVTNSYVPWNGVGNLSHTTSSIYRTTSHLGKKTDFDYDENFRRTMARKGAESMDDDGGTWFGYDAVGNLISTTDPRGNPTTFGYDNRNRQTSITNALSQTTWIEHDAVNKRKETRPDNAFRSWDYEPVNPMNRLVQTVDWRMSAAETPRTTSYTRDVKHLTEWITDAKGAVYTFTFDELHRKTAATYPTDETGANRTETWHYDAAGNLDWYKNPGHQYKFLHYDERNRVDHSWWHDSVGPDVVTNYDAASRVTDITTNNGETVVAFGYDAANRKVWEEQTLTGYPTRRVQTPVDADGNRTKLEMSTGAVLNYGVYYDYTQRNQLWHIYWDSNHAPWINYSYDASGNMTKRQNVYAGVNDSVNIPSTCYDPLNRPGMWENTRAADVPYARSWYQFDNVGREVATWRNEHGNKGERFTYDTTNQLLRAEYKADQVWTGSPLNRERGMDYAYTLDKLNRTSVTDNGNVTNYVASAMNQYTFWGGYPIKYDGNFNFAYMGGWEYSYDAQNRLVTVTNPGPRASFVYDGLGRCVKRTLAGVTRAFNYDDWKPIMEWGSPTQWIAWNAYGPGSDEILWRNQVGVGHLRYHSDRRGNVTALLDLWGNIIERYEYDAFGQATITYSDGTVSSHWSAASGVGNRFMFQGREYLSEIGLLDFRHRFYDPGMGRFLQTDPIGFDAGDMNLFRYCDDDPINQNDPLGLAPMYVPDDLDFFGRSSAFKAEALYYKATVYKGMERNVGVFKGRSGTLSLSHGRPGWRDSSGKLRSAPPNPPLGFTRPASGHHHPNGTGLSGEDRVAGDKRHELVYVKGDKLQRWRPDENPAKAARHEGGLLETWSDRTGKYVRDRPPRLPGKDRSSTYSAQSDSNSETAAEVDRRAAKNMAQLALELSIGNNAGEGFHPPGAR